MLFAAPLRTVCTIAGLGFRHLPDPCWEILNMSSSWKPGGPHHGSEVIQGVCVIFTACNATVSSRGTAISGFLAGEFGVQRTPPDGLLYRSCSSIPAELWTCSKLLCCHIYVPPSSADRGGLICRVTMPHRGVTGDSRRPHDN